MDRLQAMQTFIKVVEMNSFSRAADALGIPRASATTTIKSLEAYLNVNLMHRTTRKLDLTPAGAQYYERCVRILSDIHDCEQGLVDTGKGPRGALRVEMPGPIGRLIVAPKLLAFREQYPLIDLMIGLVDCSAYHAQGVTECAIRFGPSHDSELVSKTLGHARMLTVASPDYLERNGRPETLDSLRKHDAVHHFSHATGKVHTHAFVIDQTRTEISMKRSISLNDLEACVNCGLAGAGIIQAPAFLLRQHLAEGRLVELVPQWKPPSTPIVVEYAREQHFAGKVRVFVEWAAQLFRQCADIEPIIQMPASTAM
jgi:LysR family transcriptional regulator, regulator for bpeEF and oprC